MDRHDYVKHDAIGLATLVKRGAVTGEEVMAAAQEQIGFANRSLNAVISSIDPGPSAGRGELQRQAFAGVPLLMKDIGAAVAGAVTSCASRFYADQSMVASSDSELTRRFRAAGLRIVGKTNLPELGFNVTTEPRLFGPTCNPWDLKHSAGGSSGGAAAAVASGMVPIAHATDGAGSIRIPAACCGLVGLKPSRGALPQGPAGADIYGGLVSEGVITRTVRDTALALDIAYGADAGAPYAAPARPPSFLAVLGTPSAPLRIGISTSVPGDVVVSPASMTAIEQVASILAQLGHHVEPVDLPLDDAGQLAVREIYLMHVCAQAAADLKTLRQHGQLLPGAGSMEQINLAAARRGQSISADDFLVTERRRHDLTRRMARLWEGCDILLTPALAGAAPMLGSFPTDHQDVGLHVGRMLRFSPFTAMFNVTGEPAIALPGPQQDHLPIGIQLAAKLGDDARLLHLAADLERALAVSENHAGDRVVAAFR